MDGLPRKKQKHVNDHLNSSSIINVLPLDLLDEILFRLEPKYLAMMRCTKKYFQSYLSDPKLKKYTFWARPSFFNISVFGSCHIFCQPLVSSCDSMLLGKKTNVLSVERCYILGSCSGLLLLSHIGRLFIANPVTKKFRFLDDSGSKLIPTIPDHKDRAMCVGFAVNRNRTTMRFKIVCILEMQTVYKFEISDGYSWRLSETTITPSSKSDLMTRMKPVYLDNTLHWLRNDGSIIAFNPETEQARLIPSRFRFDDNYMVIKPLFAANEDINRLTLISMAIKRISVYTLLQDSKWALAKRIKYISTDRREIIASDVVAYDGKCLVLRQMKKDDPHWRSVVHVYDMEANCWRGLGAICQYAIVYELYKITPSLFFVEEDDEKQKVVVASNHQHMYLTSVLGAIDTTK